MAGGVRVPSACCFPLLLLLLLLLTGSSAAAAAADSHCLQLLNSSNEHGHRRSDLGVSPACGCERLALHVKLNTSGMPVDCAQTGVWHDTKRNESVSAGLASFRTVVAGCFQARCTCTDGSSCYQDWDFDGLNYYDYNLKISAVQLSGRPPRLDVHAQPVKNATQFYFPRLEVRLYRCPRDEEDKAVDHACRHHLAADRVVDATTELRVELAGSSGYPLTPGRYRIEVLPAGSWVCQGSNNGCKRIEHFLPLSGVPPVSGAVLPPAGDDRMKALYAVVGVTLAVVAAGLVFLWRECSATRPGQGAPFPVRQPPISGAPVLLVHLWPGQRLAQLKSDLRAAGLQVTDFQEKNTAAQLRSMPMADVLASDRLRHARLVFLCSERALNPDRGPAVTGSSGGGGFSTSSSLLGHEAVFSSVLHCVRNSTLAQNYQRVFVVLPEEGGGDPGPAALVPGCRFRWPADRPELIRQLRLAPAEMDRERVV